ncbi:hypothetical protein BV917_19240 [Leptospira santarosai serovar Guaricura]|nr:hypothetical protein BV917_19240 [Leptospira santarosai serovar Guaricura]
MNCHSLQLIANVGLDNYKKKRLPIRFCTSFKNPENFRDSNPIKKPYSFELGLQTKNIKSILSFHISKTYPRF